MVSRIAVWVLQYGAHVWDSGFTVAVALQVCGTLTLLPFTQCPVPLENESAIELDRTRDPLRDDLLTTPFTLTSEVVGALR